MDRGRIDRLRKDRWIVYNRKTRIAEEKEKYQIGEEMGKECQPLYSPKLVAINQYKFNIKLFFFTSIILHYDTHILIGLFGFIIYIQISYYPSFLLLCVTICAVEFPVY